MTLKLLPAFFLAALGVAAVACGSEDEKQEGPATDFGQTAPAPQEEGQQPAGKKVVWIDKTQSACDGGHTTTKTPVEVPDNKPAENGGSSGDPDPVK